MDSNIFRRVKYFILQISVFRFKGHYNQRNHTLWDLTSANISGCRALCNAINDIAMQSLGMQCIRRRQARHLISVKQVVARHSGCRFPHVVIAAKDAYMYS